MCEEIEDQKDATAFAPRSNRDVIEEMLFKHRRDLFSELEMVFFDTTSIYFEGRGGQAIGQKAVSYTHLTLPTN